MTNKPSVAAPWATVDGKTISQWTSQWLTTVMDAPANSPLADPFFHGPTDGALQNGQTGAVAFLYGGDWSGSSIPDVKIHSGQDVLVPLINALDVENGTNTFSTIDGWTTKTGLGYGAEARFVADAGSINIKEAHLTVAKTSEPTHPILSLKWPASEAFIGDTGVVSLGRLSDNTYGGHAFLGDMPGTTIDLPFADVAGRWAMLTDLSKGDYVVNYGGSMAALRNPFDHTKVIFGTPDGGDFTTDTTVRLHVT